MTYWVLKYPNGQFVGLDRDSGGYPYATNSPSQINYWDDIEAAMKYAKMFAGEKFKIRQLELVEHSIAEAVGYDPT